MCNAYCRGDIHAEVIRQYSSRPVEPLPPDRWRRLWDKELRRLGEIIDVTIAHEVAMPPGPEPYPTGAYLVTYRSRSHA